MSRSFRIAFGRCDCREPYRDPIQEIVCAAINARLADWRARLPADLAAVPTEACEPEFVEGYPVTFATSKHPLDLGDTLVVLQAFVHTWRRPTFLSIGAVGRLYAEGLLVTSTGAVRPAPDDLMWSFR